jgi:RHS repeat-associated protein
MDAAYTYNNEGKMTSVNYPETWSWQGQNGPLVSTPGPTYTYSFDAMYRPTGLTDQNSNTVVNNVTYNAANQLSTFNTETRTYNNLNQMTQLTITGSQPLNISYNFTAGQNNEKITSQTDNISAETVTYQYDSLNRLLSASSSQSWSETYGFDAFGNLLSKTPTGGAPALSQTVDPTTNRIVGPNYDANGNQLAGPLGAVAYDAENRIASAAGVQYAYDSRNKRIWRGTLSNGVLAQQVYVYGVDGQKIGTYTFTLGQYGQTNTPEMTNSTVLLATFFGRKRIGTFDRLGSAKYNQNNAAQSFYPYGEDRGTVEPNDSLKFATYTRDAATGLDYADQRYYASNFGRFMSPDHRGGHGGSPKSLNRYTYVQGDPVNFNDRRGLDPVLEDEGNDGSFDGDGGDQEALAEGEDGCPDGTVMTTMGCVSIDFSDTTFSTTVTGSPDEPETPDPPQDPTPQPPLQPVPPSPVPRKPKKPTSKCPPQYQAWINSHGADAIASGLPEANVLALSSIESGWGNGRFAAQGNDFFNLETCWTYGTPVPASKYADQSGWMQALQTASGCPGSGVHYMLVATYATSLDSFKSIAATFANLNVNDPTKFANNAVADGIYAGKGAAFLKREQMFANCLPGQ